MFQQPILELERTRPFTRASPVHLGGSLPTRGNSPVSASDSPGFSAAEESDFSSLASSHGVRRMGMGMGMPDNLEYTVRQVLIRHYTRLKYLNTHSQGPIPMSSLTSSLGISLPGKYSRVCYRYHANLIESNTLPIRALPMILKFRIPIVHLEMLRS